MKYQLEKKSYSFIYIGLVYRLIRLFQAWKSQFLNTSSLIFPKSNGYELTFFKQIISEICD